MSTIPRTGKSIVLSFIVDALIWARQQIYKITEVGVEVEFGQKTTILKYTNIIIEIYNSSKTY